MANYDRLREKMGMPALSQKEKLVRTALLFGGMAAAIVVIGLVLFVLDKLRLI